MKKCQESLSKREDPDRSKERRAQLRAKGPRKEGKRKKAKTKREGGLVEEKTKRYPAVLCYMAAATLREPIISAPTRVRDALTDKFSAQTNLKHTDASGTEKVHE